MGVPCIRMEWEAFKKHVISKNWGIVFENKNIVWVTFNGFLIVADKPKNKKGSTDLIPNSFPALGFDSEYTDM